MSKWITAWGVMTLVEAGRLDLDAPVSTYLTRWSLPTSEFDNGGVTVRRLLSHTAGLTDGLGYGGFAPGQLVQPLVASLTRAADASPGADGAVRVGIEPGSAFRVLGRRLYAAAADHRGSLGAILQRLHEGRRVRAARHDAIDLQPRGASTTNVAEFYDVDGTPAIHYRFTSLAATSLYTSAADVTRFIQAHAVGLERRTRRARGPRTQDSRRDAPPACLAAGGRHLGPRNDALCRQQRWRLRHWPRRQQRSGDQHCSRLDPATGNGVVVLETGNRLLATTMAGEWLFWRTGNVDFLTLTIEAGNLLRVLAAGWMAILLAAGIVGWRFRRPAATSSHRHAEGR